MLDVKYERSAIGEFEDLVQAQFPFLCDIHTSASVEDVAVRV